jgi:hypothetical protein
MPVEITDARAGLATVVRAGTPEKIKPAAQRARNWGPIAWGWGFRGDDQVRLFRLGREEFGATFTTVHPAPSYTLVDVRRWLSPSPDARLGGRFGRQRVYNLDGRKKAPPI